MFELILDLDSLPVEEDRVVQVQKGMNKLRVSVGEHVSEPSQVYIITASEGDLYESYILFYMLEPGIRVIYGHEGNPYGPDDLEEVEQEAVDFVEEMGAILEVVPWEGMSPEERWEWLVNESIYPGTEHGFIEEIESDELLEVLGEERPSGEEPSEEEIPTEGEEEGEEESDLEGEAEVAAVGEDLEITEELEEEPAEGGTGEEELEESREEEDYGEEEFDQLLKQAFLKPELARRTPGKARAAVDEEPEEEALPETEEALEEDSLEETSSGVETAEPEEDATREAAFAPAPGGAFRSGGEIRGEVEETPSGAQRPGHDVSSDIIVVRFLSKF